MGRQAPQGPRRACREASLQLLCGAIVIMSVDMRNPKSSCVSRTGSPNIAFEQIFVSRISR